MANIGAAIVTRWSGGNLDTDIAELYLGSGYIGEKDFSSALARFTAGTPESGNVGFPRAEFAVLKERVIKRTPESVMCEQDFFLYVWTDDENDLTSDDGFIEKISEAYNNGHQATTGRFAMTNGTVSRCAVEGSEYFPVSHNDLVAFVGEIHVSVTFCKSNTQPDNVGSS